MEITKEDIDSLIEGLDDLLGDSYKEVKSQDKLLKQKLFPIEIY